MPQGMTDYRTYGDSKGIRQTVWDLSTNYHSGNSAKRKKLNQEIEQDNKRKYYDDNHNCPITTTQHNESIKIFSTCNLDPFWENFQILRVAQIIVLVFIWLPILTEQKFWNYIESRRTYPAVFQETKQRRHQVICRLYKNIYKLGNRKLTHRESQFVWSPYLFE